MDRRCSLVWILFRNNHRSFVTPFLCSELGSDIFVPSPIEILFFKSTKSDRDSQAP